LSKKGQDAGVEFREVSEKGELFSIRKKEKKILMVKISKQGGGSGDKIPPGVRMGFERNQILVVRHFGNLRRLGIKKSRVRVEENGKKSGTEPDSYARACGPMNKKLPKVYR